MRVQEKVPWKPMEVYDCGFPEEKCLIRDRITQFLMIKI